MAGAQLEAAPAEVATFQLASRVINIYDRLHLSTVNTCPDLIHNHMLAVAVAAVYLGGLGCSENLKLGFT